MATQQDVIKAFMKSLDTSTTSGVTALNNAVKACSSFESLQSIIDKLISDCKNADSIEDFLEEKCGIILDNTDTGAITGSDAGGSKIKTAESIVPESGTASYPSGTSFTKRGLTVVIPSKSTLTKDQQTVVQGLYSWWIEEALKLIEESYGYSFTDNDTTVKKITLKFLDSSSEPAAYVTNNSTSTNDSVFKTTELTLNVNMKYFKNLSASNINGQSSETSSYLDRVLAHELTHAIMAAKIDDAQEIPNFIMEGIAELTHGADERTIDIKQLVANPTQLKARLNVNNVNSPADLDYSAGYIFLRYLAKQGAEDFSGGTGKTTNYVISDDNNIITTGGTYTIAEGFTGTINIRTSSAVILDGTNAGDLNEVKIVISSYKIGTLSVADLTIKNLKITNQSDSIITFGADKGNRLILEGASNLKTTDTWAAVIDVGGGLTIDGTGSLDVTAGSQGSGIGYRSYREGTADITINGGKIATMSKFGAGVGSGCNGSIGNITINGGTITATTDTGAGIGSGMSSSAGDISISGSANVTATSEYGAGVGSGRNGSIGNITINGGTITATTDTGAGIGSGMSSSAGDISISGSANVTATSEYGAGIGKGCDSSDKIATVGNVTISGKSYVLITQMDQVTLTGNFTRPSEFTINGKTYTKPQLLFENGAEKILSERIKVSETIKSGTDKGEYLFLSNRSWYSSATINALAGNDTINSSGANILIYAGDGNDSIENRGSGSSDPVVGYITVDAGAGDDTLWIGANMGEVNDYYSLINGGANDDSIRVNGNYFTVEGGTGDDNIVLQGKYAILNGGVGNDTITVGNENSTANGGKGNDLIIFDPIWASRANGIVLYNNGEGHDTIEGFNSMSTLQISGGTYAKYTLGSDVIVKVGNESITLKDVGNEKLNIIGTKDTSTMESLIGTEDDDRIYNNHSNVIVAGESGNDHVYSYYNNNVSIFGGTGNDYISNFKDRDGTGADRVMINGGNDNDSISNYGNNVSIFGGDGNDTIDSRGAYWNPEGYVSGGNDSFIDGESGNDYITNLGSNVTINGGIGNDSINSHGDNILFKYTSGDGNDTISGFNSDDTLQIGDGTGTYFSKTSGENIIVTVGKGKITLVGAANLSSVNIDGTEENYWILNNTTAKYGTSSKTLVTVKGVKSLNGISLSGMTVTVKESSLNKKNVTISDGYTLALGSDAPKPSISTVAHFDGLIYKSASSSDGYSLSSDKKSITYSPAVAESDLFSLTNVKNTDSISVNQSKKTVTLKANNLTGKNVSITGDYSLKLGNDVPTSTTKTAGSFTKFKSGTATFKTSSYSDFYSLKNNQVTYTAPSGGKTISIKNLKSSATLDEIKSGITISEQKNGSCKITFKSSDLLTTKAPVISATDVTYTVALDKSLNPSALAPDWKVSGTNASLKSDTSAGYTVSDNKVLYSKKVTGSPQLVLGGLVKNSSLSAPVKKVVTLDSKILGSNASLKSNAGSYTVKLTGNMSKKTFTGSANADTLNIAANNAAVLGGAGNDSFTVSGSKVTITGGKGNDSFKLSGKNPVLIYNTGDGNDTVNFVAGMQISLSGSTQIKTLGKSGSDLLLGFGKNSSVKVTGTKSTDTIKVSDASGSVTLVAGKFDLADSLTFNSKNSSVTVAKNFTGSLAPSDDIYLGGSKLSKVATINAGNVTSEISISGNAKANFISAGKNNDSILGGNGNDSIAGNAGNDKLFGQNGNDSLSGGTGNDSLWGGDGKDVFIYSAGNDVIADFTAGQDKIQIASGKISKTSLSSSDVIFTIGKGSLTVKNAKGKTISLLDSAGKASSTVVGAQALSNSNKASVTIGADMGAVDVSARTKAIKITGNALANTISGGTKNDSIFGAAGNDSILGNAGNDKLYGDAGNDILLGGKGNDFLWGGAGNDSLWGDAGKDTFFYIANESTDRIFDYEAGDMLKIFNADGSDGSFKSSKFSGGDLTLTINGGGKIIFDDVAFTTKFNINGSSYNISGSKLVKK